MLQNKRVNLSRLRPARERDMNVVTMLEFWDITDDGKKTAMEMIDFHLKKERENHVEEVLNAMDCEDKTSWSVKEVLAMVLSVTAEYSYCNRLEVAIEVLKAVRVGEKHE